MNKLTRLKRCKRCISTLMLMCCSLWMWGQNTVTGVVLDETNLEVIGANVKEKGTSNGAITDVNGTFRLRVNNLQKAVLQISFMGYESQEVSLNGRNHLKIVLKEICKRTAGGYRCSLWNAKERNFNRGNFRSR